jgi:integrase
MDTQTTALVPQDDWYAIIDLVTQSVDSPHSKRAYSRALIDFLDWYERNGRPGFTKANINAYREFMLQSGKSRSSINQALSAIRKLASEAADNGLVPPTLAYGVERVKGVKQEGVRAGNWLTVEQAQHLINTPVGRFRREEIPQLKAVRDQAVLAVMIGTGLRRSEVASLVWEQIQQRDGRWAIIDLVGKRGRVRSVGIPPWVMVALNRWAATSGERDGRIFRALNKDGRLAGRVKTKNRHWTDGNLTPQAIYNIVKEHVLAAGLYNSKGLRQIQQMLGHASITTTERYLEPMRSLQVTAGDFIQIQLVQVTD